jgi:hypothetical protein
MDPGFMNPTGAPEPLGDLGRIVWGIFGLTEGACERTHGYSPRVIRVESSRRGVSCCQLGNFLFR